MKFARIDSAASTMAATLAQVAPVKRTRPTRVITAPSTMWIHPQVVKSNLYVYSIPTTNNSSSATAAIPWKIWRIPIVVRMIAAPMDVPAATPCLTLVSWDMPLAWLADRY